MSAAMGYVLACKHCVTSTLYGEGRVHACSVRFCECPKVVTMIEVSNSLFVPTKFLETTMQ